jgi:Carboxypeptidase regulatory-like domain
LVDWRRRVEARHELFRVKELPMIRACRLVARRKLENGTRCRRWVRPVGVAPLFVALALVCLPTIYAGPPASSGGSKSQTSRSSEDGQTLRGTVVKAADGSPVAGATVYFSTGRVINRAKEARTDTGGKFEFGRVVPGKYWLFAQAGNLISNLKRFDSEPVTVKAGEAPPSIILRLAEGCRFRVTVKRASDGQPIAGAKIDFRWPNVKREFRTDASGVALLEGVRPTEQVLRARADSFAVDEKTLAAAQPGKTTELTFVLGPGGRIEGTIHDNEGRPLFNAGISGRVKRSPADLELLYVKTDGKGRFAFDNVPIGETVELHSSQRDYLRKEQTVMLSDGQKLLTVDVVLQHRPKGGSVLVTVVGPDDKPVPNARLVNPGDSSALRRYGRTDDNGQGQLDDVYDIFGRHDLGVTAKGFAPRELPFEPGPPGKPSQLKVMLETGHRIRGRVVLGPNRYGAGLRVFYAGGEHGELLGGDVTTDADGRFAIDSLPKACTFTVYSPPSYAPFHEQTLPLDGPDEVLVRLDGAALVRGHVVDALSRQPAVPYRIRIMISHDHRPGEPAPGMLTSLIEEGRVITKSDGEFEFGDFPRGTPLRLMVTADGYEAKAVERAVALPPNEFKPIEIRLLKLDPGALRTFDGRLVNADGKPVAGASVRLWTATTTPEDPSTFPFNWTMIQTGQLEQNDSCRQFLTTTTDADGRFRFSGVRVAFYAEVDYWGKGIAADRQPVHFPPDASKPMELRLHAQPGARLVVEIDRQVWPKAAQVHLSGRSSTFDYKMSSLRNGDSKLTFDDLPAGTFHLILEAPFTHLGGGRLQTNVLTRATASVRAGETATVRFGKE